MATRSQIQHPKENSPPLSSNWNKSNDVFITKIINIQIEVGESRLLVKRIAQ